MVIEVRGANTRNKGAELMLRAIAAELRDEHAIAVEPRAGSYRERAEMGLHQKVSNRLPRTVTAGVGRSLPGKVRRHFLEQYGAVFERDIDAILDASGFAYSDQFDLARCATAAQIAQRAASEGRPYILLPQAFGPFTSPERQRTFVDLVDASTLVFAREQASLDHVAASGCRMDHVRLAPDFTCLLPGSLPDGFEAPRPMAVVVPSAKLLTETSPEVTSAYLPFMASATCWLSDTGYDVRIMRHERGDQSVIEQLQALLPERLPVLAFSDATHLKGVIGTADVLVGSRFHALVSALSQGVPSLGVGWSHKYEMLFDDYGCREHVISPTVDRTTLAAHLEALTEEGARKAAIETLGAAAARERERSRAMWQDVRQALAGRPAAVLAA